MSNHAPSAQEVDDAREYVLTVGAARATRIANAQAHATEADEAVQAARTQVHEAEVALALAQRELSFAEAKSNNAKQALEDAQHPDPYLERQRAIINPIRRVPDEILSAILQSTVDKIIDESAHSLSRIRSAPYCLSWVCRRWRSAALHTRTLWRSIAINVNLIDGNPRAQSIYTTYVSTALERTGIQLVDLKILQGSPLSHEEPPLLTTLGDLIRQDRVRCLELDLSTPILALHHCVTRVPTNLRELQLKGCRLAHLDPSFGSDAQDQEAGRRRIYPSIRAVSLRPSEGDLIALAQMFPRAKSFVVDSDQSRPPSRIDHMHLQSLVIHATTGICQPLASEYCLPALSSVTIEAIDLASDPSGYAGILDFMNDACGSIKKLTLRVNMTYSARFLLGDEFAGALRLVPHLESLTLRCGIQSSFFDAMRTDVLEICPRLTVLRLEQFPARDPASMCWTSLISWAEARAGASLTGSISPLARIDLYRCGKVPSDLASRFAACQM